VSSFERYFTKRELVNVRAAQLSSWTAARRGNLRPALRWGTMADPLIESLQTLVRQSTEALGPDDPSTLMLKQQLDAALARQEESRKVFWIQPAQRGPQTQEKKD